MPQGFAESRGPYGFRPLTAAEGAFPARNAALGLLLHDPPTQCLPLLAPIGPSVLSYCLDCVFGVLAIAYFVMSRARTTGSSVYSEKSVSTMSNSMSKATACLFGQGSVACREAYLHQPATTTGVALHSPQPPNASVCVFASVAARAVLCCAMLVCCA